MQVSVNLLCKFVTGDITTFQYRWVDYNIIPSATISLPAVRGEKNGSWKMVARPAIVFALGVGWGGGTFFQTLHLQVVQ